MRDSWYSDNRDIVKWSAVDALVRENELKAVIQALFLQSDEGPGLSYYNKPIPVPAHVWDHFRNVRSAERMAHAMVCEIHIHDVPFDFRKRREYIAALTGRIRCFLLRSSCSSIPITGMQLKFVTSRHVSLRDLTEVWQSLNDGDWLAVYQHAWREKGWRDQATANFCRACSGAVPRWFWGTEWLMM